MRLSCKTFKYIETTLRIPEPVERVTTIWRDMVGEYWFLCLYSIENEYLDELRFGTISILSATKPHNRTSLTGLLINIFPPKIIITPDWNNL